ncbi:MAG: NAD(+)/NADH kinase, partial [Bifidobacteriaceae bacterium]|nr:NAD(+)/NADH kinase [Bifidobacteriaceae bacterium]MDR3152559.1 NAD(+)/NADH kinase [Bifidobacteriaceae bacterium]
MIQIVKHKGQIDQIFLDKIIAKIKQFGEEVLISDSESSVYENKPQKTSEKIKLIISLGGDGTILRASEIAFQSLAPILAVNLG